VADILPATPPAAPAPDPKADAMLTPAAIVAVLIMVIFVASLAVAYFTRDSTSLTLMIGAVISMAGTVVNFYLGSSKSSQAKDATIASLSAPTPATQTGTTP
jgi:hypothetical protein